MKNRFDNGGPYFDVVVTCHCSTTFAVIGTNVGDVCECVSCREELEIIDIYQNASGIYVADVDPYDPFDDWSLDNQDRSDEPPAAFWTDLFISW